MIKPLSRMGTWQTYSIDEGLPSLRIEHIAEDSAGVYLVRHPGQWGQPF